MKEKTKFPFSINNIITIIIWITLLQQNYWSTMGYITLFLLVVSTLLQFVLFYKSENPEFFDFFKNVEEIQGNTKKEFDSYSKEIS
jgi:hypothetical protein